MNEIEKNGGFVNIFYNSRRKKNNEEEDDSVKNQEPIIDFIDTTTKKIGDGIYFYVDEPNYQVIPDEWKQEIEFVPPVPVYTKIGGKYTPVGQDYYKKHQYQTYYWIDGTDEMDCPACSGDGLILGDDNIEYTCPRCQGIGHLYFLIKPAPIKGITTILRKAKLNDVENIEETLIVKYLATPPGAYITKTLTENDLIPKENVRQFLIDKYGEDVYSAIYKDDIENG